MIAVLHSHSVGPLQIASWPDLPQWKCRRNSELVNQAEDVKPNQELKESDPESCGNARCAFVFAILLAGFPCRRGTAKRRPKTGAASRPEQG